MGFDVQVCAMRASDRRKLLQNLLDADQLLFPGDVGPETVIGQPAAIFGLEVAGCDPELEATDGGARLDHPREAGDDVAAAGSSQSRFLGAAIGIDLADAAFEVEAKFIGLRPDIAQFADVERRAHVQRRRKEDARKPELLDVVEAAERAALLRFRQFDIVDAKLHVGLLVVS